MSTQTEFDKTINNILLSVILSVNVIPDGETFDVNDYTKAIKAAVDTYVIGKDEVFIDIPVVGITGEIESIISGKSFTPLMVAKNQFRIQQRLALWGGE